MWTLPDGPAAKVGIQRGDKVRSRQFFSSFRHVCETLYFLREKYIYIYIFYSFLIWRVYIKQKDVFGNRNRRCDCLDRETGIWILEIKMSWQLAPIETGNILQAVNACEYRQPFSPAVILIKLSTAAPNANASRSFTKKTYTSREIVSNHVNVWSVNLIKITLLCPGLY